MVRTRATSETSAGGVVYRMVHGQPVFLLIRDSYKNWGFPKGHIEEGEPPDETALREVAEETGLSDLSVRGELGAIDWFFRFRGKLIHKTCHFYLMESASAKTHPQRDEGITACKWLSYDDAKEHVSYENARDVLARALALVERLPVER
ncbi:MAG TPA: NUDIX hydrolase [Gemmatimonadaceae bacterium]|nr:NUDIX hydrolase [Gemmatimonadaceae bacterium]